MAEIIEMFPNNQNEDQPVSEDLANREGHNVIGIFSHELNHEGYVSPISVLVKTLQIKSHLGGLSGYVSPDSLSTAANLVREYSDQDLDAIIERSNESQWNSKPGYWRAVCNEYDRRSSSKSS